MDRIHTPVLLEETITYLRLGEGKTFIDATLDGGGHTEEIHRRYPTVAITGIEFDPREVEELQKTRPAFVHDIRVLNDTYTNIDAIVAEYHLHPDAILFDLGVSSWHYQASGRGFSFQKNELLDMRFNPDVQKTTAADVVNMSSEEELERILEEYGEERFAKQIAHRIVKARQAQAITNTDELVRVIRESVPAWYAKRRIHPATKTFQALRIAVNDELRTVRTGIQKAIDVLEPQGRLVVISFHGLEDKAVRTVIRENVQEGRIRWVTKDTITPSWTERQNNPRARSAKMKIIEKL